MRTPKEIEQRNKEVQMAALDYSRVLEYVNSFIRGALWSDDHPARFNDGRAQQRSKFIKELKEKIEKYEVELKKSEKPDGTDWALLSRDMFGLLQECLKNL